MYSSILYIGYVLGTYQPCTHSCNSCRRYIVITYRSIILDHVKSTYLIRVSHWDGIDTEQTNIHLISLLYFQY